MPYFMVENFRAGIDTRRHKLAAPPGTLRDILNAHVTPGGEIAKRKAFVPTFFDTTVDPDDIQIASTFGLAGYDDTVYVFQDDAANTETSGLWSSAVDDFVGAYGFVQIERQLLTGSRFDAAVPGAVALDRLLSWDVFDGKLYVVAQGGDNGPPEHFYDGARVTDVNAKGTIVKTFKGKIYALDGNTIRFCVPLDPTDWTGSGSGSISTSAQAGMGTELTGMEIYYDQLAVFSRSGVQIWDMDADPNNNALVQTIRGTGLLGGRTPRQYGNGDVLFLSTTGIRSLRAKDSSNAGAVSDVGSPVDEQIRDIIRADFTTYSQESRTLVEEHSGRFWASLGGQIYILSAFPGPDVTAWSRYTAKTEATDFRVTDMVEVRNLVFLRGDDDVIYCYGGPNASTYDAIEALAELPFMTLEAPATIKKLRGIDITADGGWDIDVNPNPEIQDWSLVARAYGSTYLQGRLGIAGHSNAVAVRARSTEAARSLLAQVVVHYDLAKAD